MSTEGSNGNSIVPLSSADGQSLLEVLFAIAIFLIGVVTIGYLIFDSQTSLRHSIESTQATLLAHEGVEALRSIRDYDFDGVETGVHGIVLSEGGWALASSSDIEGKFTRSITVSDIDIETKKIESDVSWNTTDVRESSVSLTEYLTDWRQTHGDAGDLSVDVSGAILTASSTGLTNITIENDGIDDITLTGMTLQWDGPETLHKVTLSGTDIFLTATSSGVSSDSFIDTTDYLLVVGGGIKTFDVILFSGSVAGTDLIVTFIMGDGSRKHALLDL